MAKIGRVTEQNDFSGGLNTEDENWLVAINESPHMINAISKKRGSIEKVTGYKNIEKCTLRRHAYKKILERKTSCQPKVSRSET